MGLLITIVIFVSIMGMVTLIGLKFYIRPKEAIERVTGVSVEQRENMPAHPSLAFRQILQNSATCFRRVRKTSLLCSGG